MRHAVGAYLDQECATARITSLAVAPYKLIHPVQACQEFEITQIVKQSEEQEPTQYLTADQKDLTGDFTTKLVDKNQLKKNKQG